MDFFAHQEAARRRTARLVVAFALAVALTMLTVYVPVRALFWYARLEAGAGAAAAPFFVPGLFVGVAAATLAVVLTGTLYRIHSLQRGGQAVARLVGGRPVEPNTRDLDERRLLNVVEEMAIASGVPVPSVFVLERENGINAFAAGWGPEGAVIGVSRGATRLLSRDELQGVVAHEFSHILSGDMRLNIELMGWLHGLLVIALMGRLLVQLGVRGGGGGRRRGGAAALGLFGLALLVIGGIGVFFGRLIKSGVSRQREFLADASAVQFTRNPQGLAGALKKIGGLAEGSRLRSTHAEEASHMYFANGLGASFLGLLATHPPLAERIRRLDPAFDGSYPKVELPPETGESPPIAQQLGVAAASASARLGEAAPAAVAERAGRVLQEHVEYAAGLLARLPADLRARLHEPAAAQGVVFALLAAPDPASRERQRVALRDHLDPYLVEEMERLEPVLAACPDEARLPLVDLSVPALSRLSTEQYRKFQRAVALLAEADREMSLFEFALGWIVLRHLGPNFGERRPGRVEYFSLRLLQRECSQLLSALVHYGSEEPQAAARAFARATAELGPEARGVELLELEACPLPTVAAALRKLALLAPRLKRPLVRAAAAATTSDRRVTVREAELLRAVGEALECPLPPFVEAAGSSSRRAPLSSAFEPGG